MELECCNVRRCAVGLITVGRRMNPCTLFSCLMLTCNCALIDLFPLKLCNGAKDIFHKSRMWTVFSNTWLVYRAELYPQLSQLCTYHRVNECVACNTINVLYDEVGNLSLIFRTEC